MIEVINWSIVRKLGSGYDPIILEGEFLGHPTVQSGSPSAFVVFDKEKGYGTGKSGRSYQFDSQSFQATGFAQTFEEAMDWIESNWMVGSIQR